MFLDRSAQRIVVGASRAVSSKRRFVVIPASFTLLTKTLPTLDGPSGSLRISTTRGLNLGSFVPAARKAKTCSIGRLITAEPLNFPDINPLHFAGCAEHRIARTGPGQVMPD